MTYYEKLLNAKRSLLALANEGPKVIKVAPMLTDIQSEIIRIQADAFKYEQQKAKRVEPPTKQQQLELDSWQKQRVENLVLTDWNPYD